MYVDTPHIRLICEAIDLVHANTFTIPSRWSHGKEMPSASSRIYGAFGCGVNVYLNAHTDKDFTCCATSIHMHTRYSLFQEIVAYFAFPKLGIAIPLYMGDIWFFNPKENHCISSRCKVEDDIYCISLYLKTDNIGLNNNSIPLSHHEEYLLERYNNNKTNYQYNTISFHFTCKGKITTSLPLQEIPLSSKQIPYITRYSLKLEGIPLYYKVFPSFIRDTHIPTAFFRLSLIVKKIIIQ